MNTTPTLLDRMAALSENLRARLLLLLDGGELTVSELCTVLQMPQSSVSRHLKILADNGWVQSRPDGPRRLYHLTADADDSGTRRLWLLTREQLAGTPAAEEDARRLESVLAQRRSRSQAYFASDAGRWDQRRDELFGGGFIPLALLGLLDPDWHVGDLGCGSGAVAVALAPYVRRVTGVDGSRTMLAAARRRLERFDNVDIRRGALEALPLEDDQLDAATLILVLHHLAEPARAVAEASRVLRPGGRLLVVDMLPHDRIDLQKEMGHVWLGFSREQIERPFAAAGLDISRFHALPADADARGPTLFAATAVKHQVQRNSPPSTKEIEV